MAAVPYKVYVVVDREFGEKLAELERGVPMWIVDTPTNKPVARRLWNERPDEDHLTGITTFNDGNSLSPEQLLLSHLDTIELHHGSQSADRRTRSSKYSVRSLPLMRKPYFPNTISLHFT
jgi:hypothetical protein